MSHYDNLFGDADELGNENDGRILSEDEGQPDNDGDGGDNEAGPSKPVKIEPKQRTVRNPRNLLNVQRLCGPRGIADLENYFKGFKFRGKGREADDLNAIMKRMQHWAHRMYPKYNLDDCLSTIERLGKKKQMHTYMNKYRLGMLDPVVTNDAEADDGGDENAGGLMYESNAAFNQPLDPLDSMIEEQIAISRAANTSGVADLSVSECNFDAVRDESMRTPVPPPVAPAPKEPSPAMTEEMRAKIAANRLKALEIRKAKMAAAAAAASQDAAMKE
ncbi:protein TIPIN homolog [Culex quinquefasciatus]|uniref:protein TIPIN homolog n=1 Tax=Culex quinquefasciatus TaxID=7176 RepID=UPI0018E2AC68|nr:protein TIPIN homolog [Culex quinquefasciatus]